MGKKLISSIERIAKVPATTTTAAVIRAFKELGISKVAMGKSYTEKLNLLK